MSSSSEHLVRGRVLTGAAVGAAVTANLGAVTARPARGIVVSQELVEAARQEGFATGHAEGLERGYADGLGQAQHHIELLNQLAQRLAQASDALLSREATAREHIEDAVVATAFQIAQALVGHELERPDERGRDAIARALALAPERGLVTARLSPADIELIDASLLASNRGLELVADPSVAPGDCVLDIGACRVDARVQDAIARVHEVLA